MANSRKNGWPQPKPYSLSWREKVGIFTRKLRDGNRFSQLCIAVESRKWQLSLAKFSWKDFQ